MSEEAPWEDFGWDQKTWEQTIGYSPYEDIIGVPPTPLPYSDEPVSEEAKEVFLEYDASKVDPYDEAGSLRRGGMMELGERQVRGMNIARDLRRDADWQALLA
jgi:hypothetical protein